VREPSDAALLRDSLVHPERFERIFDRHYDVVRRYAHRRVGKEAGEDIASDTFLTAFSVRSSFDGRSESARAWLFGIANNLVRHYLRAEWTRAAAWSRLPLETAEFDHVDAEKLDALRAAPAIAAAFQALHADDRETFLLFALGELTYDEVADALAIPTGTVRSRIFRVRKILREQLSDLAAIKGSDSETPGIAEGQV
jgi:RNA polymerase sigma factor (sigma-70 family)